MRAIAWLALLLALVPALPAHAGQAELAKVRQATVAFRDVAAAEAAGYQRLLDCFDRADAGMGQHYVDVSRLDDQLDVLRPESLVYQLDADGGLRLVAVEWIVPDSFPRPTLLGEQFHHEDDLGLWVLHAWIWQANPDGWHEDYNRNIPACP